MENCSRSPNSLQQPRSICIDVLGGPITRANPYLFLLYDHLRRQGVRVNDHAGKTLSCFRSILSGWRPRLIHIHWIEFRFRATGLFHTCLGASAFIGLLISLKYVFKTKMVITLNNLIPHESRFRRIEHLVFTFSLHLCDAVIVCDNYVKSMARQLYKISYSKIFAIPHGNIIDYYLNTISKTEAREKLSIPREKFVLLFFGNIRPYKGVDLLLSAFETAVKKNSNLFLLIGGLSEDPKQVQKLEWFQKRFPKNSKFVTNRIPDDEVQIFMNAADIGVLPFLHLYDLLHSSSLPLLMSFCKPIIIPRVPPSIRIPSSEFCIFFNGSESSLEKAISIAYSLRDQITFMGKKAFEKAMTLNWEQIACETHALYKQLEDRK
jgi:beta-1,4-mannosyltransferase